MKKRLIAGLAGRRCTGAASAIPAEASCRDYRTLRHASTTRPRNASQCPIPPKPRPPRARCSAMSVQSKKRVRTASRPASPRSLRRSRSAVAAALAVAAAAPASQGHVVSLIKAMAPAHGVPTWFALRIAHVESNYNAHLRGAAGEYGVFQMKCATAKGIGFRGNCGALLDARTNVQWGLKHLSIAIGKSRRQPAAGGVEAQWRSWPPHRGADLRRQGVLIA